MISVAALDSSIYGYVIILVVSCWEVISQHLTLNLEFVKLDFF